VSHLRELRIAVPRLLATTGLTGAEVSYLGDTAIGLSLVDQARADLIRVAVAVGLVNLLLLILFLRALIAPLYLLASGVLAVGAALGLTSALFQDQLGQDGLICYVPFAGWVLLVSLGSDYTLFSVGYVRAEARHPPLPARGARRRRATLDPGDHRRGGDPRGDCRNTTRHRHPWCRGRCRTRHHPPAAADQR
jgi:RND superfamily putative drug exporter